MKRATIMAALLAFVGLTAACEYQYDYEAMQCIEDNALCPWVPAECESRGEVLKEADLYGADLSGQDLRCADLRGADLYGANLSGAELFGADLRGADLYGANLAGANLDQADLRCADLYGADLTGASMNQANIAAADLYGADLSDSQGFVSRPTRDKSCRPEPEFDDDHHDH